MLWTCSKYKVHVHIHHEYMMDKHSDNKDFKLFKCSLIVLWNASPVTPVPNLEDDWHLEYLFGLFEWNCMPFGHLQCTQHLSAAHEKDFWRPSMSILAFIPEHQVSKKWMVEHRKSFEAFKSKLTNAPVLVYANVSLPFILEVDASHGGLGASCSRKSRMERSSP